MKNDNSGNNMVDMAIAIFDKVTNLNAEVSFDFDNMEVELPGKQADPGTQLKLNGTLRIRTSGNKSLK
jgi:hypothetical protein